MTAPTEAETEAAVVARWLRSISDRMDRWETVPEGELARFRARRDALLGPDDENDTNDEG